MIEPSRYFVAKPTLAQQLYSRVQSLGLAGTEQKDIGLAESITYHNPRQVLHVSPGTTVRIVYQGTLPSTIDHAEVTFFADDKSQRDAARVTLETFAKVTFATGVPAGQ